MRPIKRFGVLLAALLATICVPPAVARAQIAVYEDPGSAIRTRAELEELLAGYDDVLASPAYSEAVKATTRMRADRVRQRLTLGDFMLGDRVVLSVQGETALPDTVPVEAGQIINLANFGEISVAGVLRSEIQDHLTRELGRYINDPVVRAEGLLRVSIQGTVSQPGFYVIPADMLLTEAIMVAGGPSQTSDLEGLRVERGPTLVMDGPELQEALRLGRTFDQLNLQAGDQLYLPADAGGFWRQVAFALGIVTSVVVILRFVN
jgi:protein involved in polysaccharide export with SLBB domain